MQHCRNSSQSHYFFYLSERLFGVFFIRNKRNFNNALIVKERNPIVKLIAKNC